jgi:transposase-like protein
MAYPTTLVDAIKYFSDQQICINEVAAMKWPDGNVSCAGCGEIGNVIWLANQKRWKCRGCKKQFSVKVGTIFEDSPLGLDKWMVAMWMLANCKNGVSSYEVHRAIGVTQKSAWFMLHRIRTAMKQNGDLLGEGPVEVDEVYIGGKPSNMHVDKRFRDGKEILKGDRKTPVIGMLDRGSREVRAKVIPNAKRETLQKEILEQVGFGSTVYTDGWKGYNGLKQAKFVHDTVSHMNEYVRGQVHTQGIENFWSCLKRTLNGTYVAVEPFHLDAYVDEQVFRYNNRHDSKRDAGRFKSVLKDVVGRRLTYAELTGKGAASAAF